MKRIGLLLVVLLSFLILTNKTMAACPDGYSQTTKQMLINGCYYDVEICYICITTNPPIRVIMNGFTKVDPNCTQLWTTDQVTQAIYNILYNINYIRTEICDQVPPCSVPPDPPTGIIEWYIRPVCWHKIRTSPTHIRYEPCAGSSLCITKWRVCWDAQTGIEQRTLLEGPILDYPSSCPTGPEPPDPEGINESSECFILSTPCNP